MMNDFDDPNAPSRNQQLLKRAENALRRRCDCGIYLTLDGIAQLKDGAQIRIQMAELQRQLETKPKEESNDDV